MGCAASKPLLAEREEANTLAAKPPTAGPSAGAAAIVKQEQQTVPADVKAQLVKMEAMIAEFEEKLAKIGKVSHMVGKAGDAISAANTVIEMVGDAVPVFGGAFHALNKILTAVQQANELVRDVVEVGRSIARHLKWLIMVGRKALDMKGEAQGEVNDAIVDVIRLLDELSEVVGQFGKPGFVKRMWSAGTKAAKTLKSLKGEICDKIKTIDKMIERAEREEVIEQNREMKSMLTKLVEDTLPSSFDQIFDKIASKVEEMVQARKKEKSETDDVARAALEEDEDANTKLESVMKESFKQLDAKIDKVDAKIDELQRELNVKMDQLKKEPNKGYWLEVAIEVPPAVFDASAHDRAAIARLINRLEGDLIERRGDLRSRGHYPICITDAAHQELVSDLEAGDVNILVWCGLGCNVADCAGSENAVNLKELMAKLSAKKKPRLVVVCMKYGARQIAEKLKGLGAALVWVEADVMSQNSNFERSLAPKKPLLAAVLAQVSSNLARSGSDKGLIKLIEEVGAAGGKAGMIDQGHENLLSQLEWKAHSLTSLPEAYFKAPSLTSPPEAYFIVPRVSRLPATKTNIFTSLSEENNEELKLLACDISRTKELHREIAKAVSKDKCPLKRCISSKEITATIMDEEAARAARYRVRAVALAACNAFIHGGTFEAVYRIESSEDLLSVKTQLKASKQKVTRALFWLDLKKVPAEEFRKEIDGLIDDFADDDYKSVFLLTPTPAHLSGGDFKAFELESIDAIGGGKYKASDLYEEITFEVKRGKMPVNFLELLEPEEFAKILKGSLKKLFHKSTAAASFTSSSPSPLVGLYLGNTEQTVVARFCVSSVGFLHQLRDRVLDGSLVNELRPKLGEALKEVKGVAPASQLPFLRRMSAKISKNFRNLKSSQQHEEEPRGEAASSESEMTIAVDLSHFAETYESSILQLDQLTPHQEKKMGDALTLLRGDLTHIVHLTAPAGAGKTFVAQQIVLDLLKDLSSEGIILFSARTVPLCLFFVKWLVKRFLNSRGEVEDEQMIQTILDRVQVLHAPYEQGPLAVKLNEEKGDIEFGNVPEGSKAQSILLVVEDEAHHTYGDPELKLQVERQILRWAPCHRLLLSDVSQSQSTEHAEIAYPEAMKVVELTEVVRSTKRIITAANDFSLCGPKEKVPTCHHASEGPPLQTFLFDMQEEDEPRRDEMYAEQTIAALQSVVTQFERLPLHDRLAIIVPDEGMRAMLQGKLKVRLAAAFRSRSFELVDAQRASRTYKKGVGSSEWLVLDTIENMDGLERLIVIAVGLDSPIPENSEAAAEGDVLRTRSTLHTRSQLYRALTRAHMLVCVVNETLGLQCWLAYLRNLKLSKGGTFDEAAAVAKTTVAAERTLENEKMRVTKCKEEAKAAVEAVAKKHLLGEEAVEWCSAMVAKKLLDGGAAKEAAKEAVCEWLIKPEMAVVEKMAAAPKRGLEAAEARAAVVRCVRSKLLESSARAPLKGGEGEVALAAVLVQWRRIGEELENALAAQEGLEGVEATESIRIQVAVLAVVAKGGELKAAVVAEVQRWWMQMKEAAEQEVKEEKLRAAMAALLAGEAESLDKVACDWICADAVKRMEVGAGGSEVDGKMAVQAAVAAWRQRLALQAAVTERSYQVQTEQEVWDTKANQSGVVWGVLAFDPTSLNSDDKSLDDLDDKIYHAFEGPPLQTFLFDMQEEDEPRRDELYAERTMAALQSVVTQFERLPLHDRLAIIVPDESMRAMLQGKLEARLAAAFPSRSFELVDAQRVSRTYKKGVGSSEWLVLDTIENMDGLERLIVIAVGLDSPIPENAEAVGTAAEGNVLQMRSFLQTRSHLYRALTRAHMLVCVVNETLPRGLLAELLCLKLSKDRAFGEAAALAAGAGDSKVDGKMAVRIQDILDYVLDTAVANLLLRLEASQTEQSVWDTKANQSGVGRGMLAFDPSQTEQSVWDTKANQSGVGHGMLAFARTFLTRPKPGPSQPSARNLPGWRDIQSAPPAFRS
jgi:hypothetical protein